MSNKRSKPIRGKTGKRASIGKMKQEMLRILLRGRSETLTEACKVVGITPTTFYYRLKHAEFGSPKRGRTPKVAISSIEAKRLATLIRRQERLQYALTEFKSRVL